MKKSEFTRPAVSPSDDEHASELVRQLSGSNEEADFYGEWLFERTRRLVDSEPFWMITSAVARALMTLETLSMTATRKVIRDALQPSSRDLERSNYILEPPSEG